MIEGAEEVGEAWGGRKPGRDKVSRLFSCDVEQLAVSAKGQRCSCLPPPSKPPSSPVFLRGTSALMGRPGPFPLGHKTQLHPHHHHHSPSRKRYPQITNHFEWVKTQQLWGEKKGGRKEKREANWIFISIASSQRKGGGGEMDFFPPLFRSFSF